MNAIARNQWALFLFLCSLQGRQVARPALLAHQAAPLFFFSSVSRSRAACWSTKPQGNLNLSQVSLRSTAMDSGAAAAAAPARAAEKLCRRCKVSYDPSGNTRLSCRFHPSLFVCRRHDDQKRLVSYLHSGLMMIPVLATPCSKSNELK